MYRISNESSIPLHIQLYNELKDDITAHMQQGDKLPSIRKLAATYNISKTTVQNAYDQLYAEGYIQSKAGSGYFVSDLSTISPLKPISPIKPINPIKPISTISPIKPTKYRYDFFPAQLTDSSFPRKIWKRLSNRAFEEGLDFGSYPDGQGEYGLREQIAKYLEEYRGVECTADDMVITSGFIDSMSLIAKLLKLEHTVFATEEPGYHIARKIFDSFGYKIEKIAVGNNGVDIGKFSLSSATVLYVTPSHQYPTGVSIPVSARYRLLQQIRDKEGYIIEDDYDSELKYSTRPIPALKGLDEYDGVIYLGTFAKALSPAVRIGYMVLPPRVMALYRQSYDSHFARVSQHLQRTLELFMRDGHFERHLRRIRTLNRKKHDAMLKALYKHLRETYEVYTKGGGLSILIRPTIPFDWNKCIDLCENKNIKVYLTKERAGGDIEAFRMGFGGFEIGEIEPAIREFAKCWHNALVSK